MMTPEEIKKRHAESVKKWLQVPANREKRKKYCKAYRKKQLKLKILRVDGIRKKPNYPTQSYCAGCERVFPKAKMCPQCHKRMRWGKRGKKEVFRY